MKNKKTQPEKAHVNIHINIAFVRVRIQFNNVEKFKQYLKRV